MDEENIYQQYSQHSLQQQDQIPDIDPQGEEEFLDDQIQENSRKMIQLMCQQFAEQQKQQQPTQQVRNPISPYLIFVKNWKKNHEGQKTDISIMGKTWRQLSEQEKKPYIDQFHIQRQLYKQYQNKIQLNNPQKISSNYAFPLHRIKCIMKQDQSYTPSQQSVVTMAKTTQYFGLFLLEEVRKHTQGKSRITVNDLYQCIRVKNKVLWFLECLIDQNTDIVNQKKCQELKIKNDSPKQHILLQIQPTVIQNKPNTTPKKLKPEKISNNQLKLTDMFRFN